MKEKVSFMQIIKLIHKDNVYAFRYNRASSRAIMAEQTFCTSFTFKPGAAGTTSSTGVPAGEAPQAGALAQARTNMDAAQQVAALNLSPTVLAAYRKKFDAFDLNKDGIITRREFLAVSKVFGYSLTSEEIMVS